MEPRTMSAGRVLVMAAVALHYGWRVGMMVAGLLTHRGGHGPLLVAAHATVHQAVVYRR